ncbi:type I restriction modification DNA specificity domain protein [Filifactor alocis ATCC 35896]|uniref:Type I restriction modification DNA specificity domain protein n=1 Tax=Filifactor alocis (strain ATCC 35896 / CCUG 47790 / D40 B5) TaxID=546269 RepID=D6GQR5_FILAD|nr:restriction endonuclease subunit S [Filifactor alocis]EFE29118.2 type I restriction modification DNA specificity domain protein [Filifactor alocis ATCC 35896]
MKCKLEEICSFRTGKTDVANLTTERYISTENMLPNKSGIVNATSLPIVDLTQAYEKGDVLVSNIRPYFKKIWKAKINGGCSNDVLVFTAKENTDSDFLYYVLANDAFFAYAMATSKGTKMPRGDKKSIMQYEVPCYDIETQQKIASILKSIDEKIELNNAINNNLEQQAKTLFKSWFVDCEPFNGKQPDDWILGTIDDLAKDVVCGKTPSTKKEEYYGGYIPFITIPDMHNCVYSLNTARSLSTLGAESQSKKTLPVNSVCVSCIGTAGLVTLVPVPSQTNQQINSIIPKNTVSPYYVYLLMKTMSEIINKLGQSGSTIVNLNKAQFGKIEVIIPSTKVMLEFTELVEPIFELILLNQKENNRLSNLRDTLLPKLMSGELDVSDIYL